MLKCNEQIEFKHSIKSFTNYLLYTLKYLNVKKLDKMIQLCISGIKYNHQFQKWKSIEVHYLCFGFLFNPSYKNYLMVIVASNLREERMPALLKTTTHLS